MQRSTSIVAFATACAVGLPILMAAPASARYYGPDTCSQGYVWRGAYPGDHVCVRPWVRAQAAADNFAAPDRVYGSGRCVQGYVWREAYPGDHVCVSVETRARAARDNERAPYRFAY
jgi:hypothetical protein